MHWTHVFGKHAVKWNHEHRLNQLMALQLVHAHYCMAIPCDSSGVPKWRARVEKIHGHDISMGTSTIPAGWKSVQQHVLPQGGSGIVFFLLEFSDQFRSLNCLPQRSGIIWKCLKMVCKQGLLCLLVCVKISFFGLWTFKFSWKPFTQNVQRNRGGLQIRIIDSTWRIIEPSCIPEDIHPLYQFFWPSIGWVMLGRNTTVRLESWPHTIVRRSLNSALFLARNCLTLLLGEPLKGELESSIEIRQFEMLIWDS